MTIRSRFEGGHNAGREAPSASRLSSICFSQPC
jgi:hypothetical protein